MGRAFVPLIPALGRQRHVDLCEVKAILVYIASVSFRRGSKATQRNPVSKKQKQQKREMCLNLTLTRDEFLLANLDCHLEVTDIHSRNE